MSSNGSPVTTTTLAPATTTTTTITTTTNGDCRDAVRNGHDERVHLDTTTSLSPAHSATPRGHDKSRMQHTIRLSSIDHCMPRAYIRVCLAFRLPHPDALHPALAGLGQFLEKVVHATPFLAGYVVPAQHDDDGSIGRVEIRFTEEDVHTFPAIQTRTFSEIEMPWPYEKLSRDGLPPSTIRPEIVSALPEWTHESRAPVFRVQANVLPGGLIVSIYLHHCVTDGYGLGLLLSGSTIRHSLLASQVDGSHLSDGVNGNGAVQSLMNPTLAEIAHAESQARSQLSSGLKSPCHRQLAYRVATSDDNEPNEPPTVGRGCVFTIPHSKLDAIKEWLVHFLPKDTNDFKPFITDHDVLQAFLWRHVTLARRASISPKSKITTSTLLIPVNIRNRMLPPLAPSYFGSAVDFACVTLPISQLSSRSNSSAASTALAIRHAVTAVQDSYVRAAIELSNTPSVDVRDLQAANMNRTTGADMYITSWLNLPFYDKGDLGMGLGMPDWVRKPWSRDPGACIILPQDPRRNVVEVVIQLTEPDMNRLLKDQTFMDFVEGVLE